MARPKKLTLDEQLKWAQDEHIKTRKRCDELAAEIERLSKLQSEALAKQLLDAISTSNKSYEEIMAFITEGSSSDEEE